MAKKMAPLSYVRSTLSGLIGKRELRDQIERLESALAKSGRAFAKSEKARAEAAEELADASDRARKSSERVLRTRSVLEGTRADLETFKDLALGATSLDDKVNRVAVKVIAERLTMIGPKALTELCELAGDLERAEVPGIFVETGTARGGSAILLAAAKDKERELRVYDVFAMIPPPSEADGDDVKRRYDVIASGNARGIGDSNYYGYDEDLYGGVTRSFADCGYPVDDFAVKLIKGLFEDTLEFDGPIALAHLDGDWYESTKVSLERIVPHLSIGGYIVIDDYVAWSGCRQAVDEYFADRTDFRRDDKTKVRFERVSN